MCDYPDIRPRFVLTGHPDCQLSSQAYSALSSPGSYNEDGLIITSVLPGTRKYVLLAPLLFALALSGQSTPGTTTLLVPGGRIDVTLPQEQLAVSPNDLLDWARDAANAVSTYYGHFPIPHLTLRISSDNRSGVHHGVTYPK